MKQSVQSSSKLRKLILTLFLSVLASLCLTGISAAADEAKAGSDISGSAQEVTVTDQGSSVTISNSIVTATVTKGSAVLTSLTYKGGPNLLANGGSGYYILNYSQNGKSLKFGPSTQLSYQLTALDDRHVDISLSVNDPDVIPFGYEMHFVLEKGVSGLYIYEVLRYPEEVEGGATIGQGRYAIRVDPKTFTQYAVDDVRKGLLPTPQELKNGEEVMDATVKLANGDVYTKYNHMVYVGDFDVTGLYGDRIGISQIRPSNDFAGGGPMQQRNSLHQTETTPILLWHDYESHMGREALTPTKGWEKIYGPTLFYIHEGNGLDELWSDAKAFALQEKQRWPYSWLNNPLYAADTRGSVTGRLTVSDGTSTKDAWVILGEPDVDSQNQNLDYLYYARADEQGNFQIDHVRPGTYTLYAVVKGEFGEFRYDGVEVKENDITRLPSFLWTPPTNGRTLWQIGIADRTSGEFRHGDDYHQWGNWLEYPLDFPNGVDFYVGHSKERTDWNYAHPVNATPGEPSQVKVPYDKSLAAWNVRFDVEKALAGTATLTFGLASSRNGTLNVDLNGQQIADLTSLPGPKSDSAMPRSAIHGYYREIQVTFDAALLREGQNVLSLRHAQNIFDEEGNRIRDLYTSIEYDAIRLEVDEPAAVRLLNKNGTVTDIVYTVQGSVSKAAVVAVNGSIVPIRNDLTFSAQIQLTEGVNIVTVQALNAAGVPVSTQTLRLLLDTVPPATTHELTPVLSSDGKYVAGLSVKLTAADVGSGVLRTEYRINSGSWTVYTVPFVIQADTTHTLEFRSIDPAGNTEKVWRFDFDKGTLNQY